MRLFLDTGVIIEGCTSRWGASKAVLIHLTYRESYTVVLAEAVEQELRRNVADTLTPPERTKERDRLATELAGWLKRVRLERWPAPTEDQLRDSAPTVLPVLRHLNDLPAVVTAMQARPDWIISANSVHWSEALATRTGLRILTPHDFISRLRPS